MAERKAMLYASSWRQDRKHTDSIILRIRESEMDYLYGRNEFNSAVRTLVQWENEALPSRPDLELGRAQLFSNPTDLAVLNQTAVSSRENHACAKYRSNYGYSTCTRNSRESHFEIETGYVIGITRSCTTPSSSPPRSLRTARGCTVRQSHNSKLPTHPVQVGQDNARLSFYM